MSTTTNTYLTFITTDGNYTININNNQALNLILNDSQGTRLGAFDRLDEAIEYAYGVAALRRLG